MITLEKKLEVLNAAITAEKVMISSADYLGLYDEVKERNERLAVLSEVYYDIMKFNNTSHSAEKTKTQSLICPQIVASRMQHVEKLSEKSPDKFVKHGCIIFGQTGKIISTGVNRPPIGFNENQIDQNNKIERKPFNEHAERAAIFEAAKEGLSLKGSYFYITGQPCPECLRAIIATGAHGVIYGDRLSNSSVQHAITNKKLLETLEHKFHFSMHYYNKNDNTLLTIS